MRFQRQPRLRCFFGCIKIPLVWVCLAILGWACVLDLSQKRCASDVQCDLQGYRCIQGNCLRQESALEMRPDGAIEATESSPDVTQPLESASERPPDSIHSQMCKTSISGALLAKKTQLSEGRVELRYNFEQSNELDDWQPLANVSDATVENKQLHVWNRQGSSIGVVIFRQAMLVDKVAFTAQVVHSEWPHINAYFNTLWEGEEWAPLQAYGAIHRGPEISQPSDPGERGFVLPLQGERIAWSTAAALRQSQIYKIEISHTTDTLTWSVDGVVKTTTIAPYNRTDRCVILGGYESRIAISELRIEGKLP